MAQTPKKKKRKLPKDITERTDHEVMEILFGKRIMKKIDTFVSERSEDPETNDD